MLEQPSFGRALVVGLAFALAFTLDGGDWMLPISGASEESLSTTNDAPVDIAPVDGGSLLASMAGDPTAVKMTIAHFVQKEGHDLSSVIEVSQHWRKTDRDDLQSEIVALRFAAILAERGREIPLGLTPDEVVTGAERLHRIFKEVSTDEFKLYLQGVKAVPRADATRLYERTRSAFLVKFRNQQAIWNLTPHPLKGFDESQSLLKEVHPGMLRADDTFTDPASEAPTASQSELDRFRSPPVRKVCDSASDASNESVSANDVRKIVAISRVCPRIGARFLVAAKSGAVTKTHVQDLLKVASEEIGERSVELLIQGKVRLDNPRPTDLTGFFVEYRPMTSGFGALLAQQGESTELMQNTMAMMIAILDVEDASIEDMSERVNLSCQVVELTVALYREELSWSFLSDIIRGFPGGENRGQKHVDYLNGAITSLHLIKDKVETNLKKRPAAVDARDSHSSFAISLEVEAPTSPVQVALIVRMLDNCFRTGDADVDGNEEVWKISVPNGLR